MYIFLKVLLTTNKIHMYVCMHVAIDPKLISQLQEEQLNIPEIHLIVCIVMYSLVIGLKSHWLLVLLLYLIFLIQYS